MRFRRRRIALHAMMLSIEIWFYGELLGWGRGSGSFGARLEGGRRCGVAAGPRVRSASRSGRFVQGATGRGRLGKSVFQPALWVRSAARDVKVGRAAGPRVRSAESRMSARACALCAERALAWGHRPRATPRRCGYTLRREHYLRRRPRAAPALDMAGLLPGLRGLEGSWRRLRDKAPGSLSLADYRNFVRHEPYAKGRQAVAASKRPVSDHQADHPWPELEGLLVRELLKKGVLVGLLE